MTYLILFEDKVFATNWFDAENNFVNGMTVINIAAGKYTMNGTTWFDIEQDHL